MPEPKKTPSDRSKALPKISNAEWTVMNAVWEKAPVTANQVVELLERRTHWKPKTIHTLLSRLVQKRALEVDKSEREHVFRPLIEARDYLHAASRSFLSQFFGGRVAPFLACLMDREKLSPKEIAELKRLLDDPKS